MSSGWQPCAEIVQIEGRGPVRCWKPPVRGGIGLCSDHEWQRLADEESRLTGVLETIRQEIVKMRRQIDVRPIPEGRPDEPHAA